MSTNTLAQTLNKDFDRLFKEIKQFRDSIPSIVKIIGLEAFIKHMDFTKNQYYSRVNNPEKWRVNEMEKASEFFKLHNFGQKN